MLEGDRPKLAARCSEVHAVGSVAGQQVLSGTDSRPTHGESLREVPGPTKSGKPSTCSREGRARRQRQSASDNKAHAFAKSDDTQRRAAPQIPASSLRRRSTRDGADFRGKGTVDPGVPQRAHRGSPVQTGPPALVPQLPSVQNRWSDIAALSDKDSDFNDADHNLGEQALADELPRPPEALGSGSGGAVADPAGCGSSGKQFRVEESPSQIVEPKPSDVTRTSTPHADVVRGGDQDTKSMNQLVQNGIECETSDGGRSRNLAEVFATLYIESEINKLKHTYQQPCSSEARQDGLSVSTIYSAKPRAGGELASDFMSSISQQAGNRWIVKDSDDIKCEARALMRALGFVESQAHVGSVNVAEGIVKTHLLLAFISLNARRERFCVTSAFVRTLPALLRHKSRPTLMVLGCVSKGRSAQHRQHRLRRSM